MKLVRAFVYAIAACVLIHTWPDLASFVAVVLVFWVILL